MQNFVTVKNLVKNYGELCAIDNLAFLLKRVISLAC